MKSVSLAGPAYAQWTQGPFYRNRYILAALVLLAALVVLAAPDSE
jgi:hypothetical protein